MSPSNDFARNFEHKHYVQAYLKASADVKKIKRFGENGWLRLWIMKVIFDELLGPI